MIELKFYRDDEYVYINNPDGTTKRVAIEDFESAISGEGGSGSGGVPIYSDSSTIYLIKDTELGGFRVKKYDETVGRAVPYPFENLFTDIANGVEYTFDVTDDDDSETGEIYPNEVILVVDGDDRIIIGTHNEVSYELSEGSEKVDTIIERTTINLNKDDTFISNISTSRWNVNTGSLLYSIQSSGVIEGGS